MAITEGVGPHKAWLTVNGLRMLVERGSVQQSAKRKSSTFHCQVPLGTPGAYDALRNGGDVSAVVEVLTRGNQQPLLTGEVDEVDVDYVGRMIHISGRDLSAKLHEQKSSEKWQNKKTTEIVKELAERAGLKTNISGQSIMAGKLLEQDHVKLSDNVSLAYVIHKLAELDGARWWVDAKGVFHYAAIGSNIGNYSVYIDQTAQPIKSDCIHLKLKVNLQASKPHKVRFRAWHPRQKKVNEFTATVPGVGTAKEHHYIIPTLKRDQVEQYAKAQAMERVRHELTVSATVVGDPSVAAGMALTLSGTDYFDQSFDIDTVHHEFGMRGHTTHITARSARKGRIPA